jgi:glycosyltransferase involved in cell wall biosynthesis
MPIAETGRYIAARTATFLAALGFSASDATIAIELKAASCFAVRSWDMRVLVQYDRRMDVDSWRQRHAAGLVPDAAPYGLHYLTAHGFDVAFRRSPSSYSELLMRPAEKRLGLDFAAIVDQRSARRRADVVLSWNEGVGLPTAFARSRDEPPSVTGIIWMTEAGLPRGLLSLVRGGIRRSAAVFVCSKAQIDRVVALGAPLRRVHYVPMGIDDEMFQPHVDDSPEPNRIIAFGNDRHRDWRLLARSVALLKQRVRDVRLHVYSQKAPEFPAEVGTVHRDHVDVPQIRDAYARAAVVVIPTKPNVHVSGVTVALEAMALGRPVVACDTPGMSDYVIDGVTGFLVPPGSPEELRDKVAILLNDSARSSEMGAAGKEVLQRRFTTRNLAAQLSLVLRAACEGEASPL